MISIIVPIYNRADLLAETLDTIKEQSYEDWECILVDDGSTDTSLELLRSYSERDERFRVFQRGDRSPKGPSTCRNIGFENSKGRYIQFFDSDDLMHKDNLNNKMLKMLPRTEVVIGRLFFFDDHEPYEFRGSESLASVPDDIFESFATGSFSVLMVAPLWRRDFLAKHMPIRQDMHILEDHELYARTLRHVKQAGMANDSIAYIRQGHRSSTKRFYANIAYGIDSYLEAKKTVVQLAGKNSAINKAVVRMVVGVFRAALAQKDYDSCEKCLGFVRTFNIDKTLKTQLALFRINSSYRLFKLLGRGDHRFRGLLRF